MIQTVVYGIPTVFALSMIYFEVSFRRTMARISTEK